jgi:hypothetical protein
MQIISRPNKYKMEVTHYQCKSSASSNLLPVMAVFWVVALCSLVEVYQRFRGPFCLHHRPDDGGSKNLWNVGKLLQDYTALQPRRQPSSYSPPWESQILLTSGCFSISVLCQLFCRNTEHTLQLELLLKKAWCKLRYDIFMWYLYILEGWRTLWVLGTRAVKQILACRTRSGHTEL